MSTYIAFQGVLGSLPVTRPNYPRAKGCS